MEKSKWLELWNYIYPGLTVIIAGAGFAAVSIYFLDNAGFSASIGFFMTGCILFCEGVGIFFESNFPICRTTWFKVIQGTVYILALAAWMYYLAVR